MSIGDDWLILDTNVWVFGLREVLRQLPGLHVKIPRQVLLELRANLSAEKTGGLFRVVNRYPECVDVQWDRVDSSTVWEYRELGCRHGGRGSGGPY